LLPKAPLYFLVTPDPIPHAWQSVQSIFRACGIVIRFDAPIKLNENQAVAFSSTLFPYYIL
jgi:hypothetical protein